MGRTCLYCETGATYGNKEVGIAFYCFDHKRLDDVNVLKAICKDPCCGEKATHGDSKIRQLEFCKVHAHTEHFNLTHPACVYPDCKGTPLYGLEGSKIPLYCYQHTDSQYVNVVTRTCEKCGTQPSYGKIGTIYPQFCFAHKPEDYVNVRDKKCIYPGCITVPCYGLEGTIKRVYCATHAPTVGYVDVRNRNKQCLYEDCEIRASYGPSLGSRAEYCRRHTKPDHPDYVITHPCSLCEFCEKQATFGDPIDRIAMFCGEHKEECPGAVDVKHKMCEGCIKDKNPHPTRASYGKLFSSPIHGACHKSKNEYLKFNPKCTSMDHNKKCKLQPCYTDKYDNYPLRCEDHQLPGDKNVVERPCQSCGLSFYIKDGNLCNDCHSYFVLKNDKVKEKEVKSLLERHNFKFIYDRRIQFGCNQYRPDFVIDCGSHIIIIECDENQHKSYACECEQGRMINIFQDFGGLPVTFIRYNPDNYVNHKGQKMIGSHQINQQRLISAIKSIQLHQPTYPLSVVYLCYDGDDGSAKVIQLDYERSITKEAENLKSIHVPQLPKIKLKLKAKTGTNIPLKI